MRIGVFLGAGGSIGEGCRRVARSCKQQTSLKNAKFTEHWLMQPADADGADKTWGLSRSGQTEKVVPMQSAFLLQERGKPNTVVSFSAPRFDFVFLHESEATKSSARSCCHCQQYAFPLWFRNSSESEGRSFTVAQRASAGESVPTVQIKIRTIVERFPRVLDLSFLDQVRGKSPAEWSTCVPLSTHIWIRRW